MRLAWGLTMVLLLCAGAGCAGSSRALDNGVNSGAPLTEPDWIRNGEAIELENNIWFPTREVERFMDGEMFRIGNYRGVEVFIERTDIRPFARLYTRFDQGRYRAFEAKNR
ncbi:MAG: hypothetical protein HQL20_10565 [Candidatus Omnitrophica bacterium]|nr:hypothetical protein [Candidatus Omnitrophota bacterium]